MKTIGTDLFLEELREWARRLASSATYYNYTVDRFKNCRGRYADVLAAERDFYRLNVEAHIEGLRTEKTMQARSSRVGFPLDEIARVSVTRRTTTVSCTPRTYRKEIMNHDETEKNA